MAGREICNVNRKISYRDDPRMPCKYGLKCYQKNKTHHEKYKHPPNRSSEERKVKENSNSSSEEDNFSVMDAPKHSEKKRKLDDSEEETSLKFENETHSELQEIGSIRRNHELILPPSPSDPRENIKQNFLVEMPEDFYQFWNFCETLSKNSPARALDAIGLTLVGPYDVLSGDLSKVEIRDSSSYLRHWRYYFDPPEFQTVIKGDNKTQFHIGYYRDDPNDMPVFVASNSAALSCTLNPMAGNLFGAVNSYMNGIIKSGDPFRKVKVPKLQNALKEWAMKESISLEPKTPAMKERQKKVVASTFHRAGIVVPYDRKTEVGYRELLEPDSAIKKILASIVESETETEKNNNFSKLQPIITAANIANDECDFGASLELGMDLFSYGGEIFHKSVLQLLQTAYKLLQRPQFAAIIKAHLQNRSKGIDLSIIEKNKT